MQSALIVSGLVAAVAIAVGEYVLRSRRKADEARMMADWDQTEASIKSVLAEPGRETIIENVVLRAQAQQATLDHLCQITASALEAPAAVITVVEVDGQRWLAHYGASWCPTEVRNGLIAPLETSYCKFVVTTDKTLTIVDSLRDVRVRNAAEATLHSVRAYIGAPVHSNGVPVGSLCVFDTEPRRWTKRDRVTVEAFASLVAL